MNIPQAKRLRISWNILVVSWRIFLTGSVNIKSFTVHFRQVRNVQQISRVKARNSSIETAQTRNFL